MKICSRCILDSTVPELALDANGVCQYCRIHLELEKQYPLSRDSENPRLAQFLAKIKKKGRGKKYDCLLGTSGGTDSTYTMYLAVKHGLRPLAVHFDNGWNSDKAVRNIMKACSKLNIDLHTHVVDWEEFKDLQRSFLLASTPDADIPTDVGIHSLLIRTAAKEGIRYVLNGHSFRTEGVCPLGWTYMDGRYLKSVHSEFGTRPLRTFPNYTLFDFVYFNLFRKIQVVPFLNFFDYEKEKARTILEKELGWKYYGGHHHENIFTRFFHTFVLPNKFGIDLRKVELSAMTRSGHLDRETALKTVGAHPYSFDSDIVDYAVKKLGWTRSEFEVLMKSQVKSFRDYPTYNDMISRFRWLIQIGCRLNLVPQLLYFKFIMAQHDRHR